ncbi:hypothetical protein GQ600_8393 [Phytophthora cactorum]|nr:hypothetical protein GQ600_8393 [Phytophthora cactorum]
MLQKEGFTLLAPVANGQLGLQCFDGTAKSSLLLCVALMVNNEFLFDPLVRAHTLPVIEPEDELAISALCCHLLHSRATTNSLNSDAMPLLETLATLRLQSFSSQHVELQPECGERSPLVETVVGDAEEIAPPESVHLLLQLLHVANVCLKRTDTSAQEVRSSKGIGLDTLLFPELSSFKPLHDTSPVLLLMA